MNTGSVLIWGFAATVVLTTILRASQAFGRTRIDLPFILGAMFTPDRDKAKVYGAVIHLVNGWLFAMVYALAFQAYGRAGADFGALIGAVQGAFVVVVAIPLLPAIHPRMATDGWGPDPTQQLEPPGNFGLNYGLSTPVVTFLGHVVYGAILGLCYRMVY
jgi:uncharacterized membrane protein YagU involved in acid resistance